MAPDTPHHHWNPPLAATVGASVGVSVAAGAVGNVGTCSAVDGAGSTCVEGIIDGVSTNAGGAIGGVGATDVDGIIGSVSTGVGGVIGSVTTGVGTIIANIVK